MPMAWIPQTGSAYLNIPKPATQNFIGQQRGSTVLYLRNHQYRRPRVRASYKRDPPKHDDSEPAAGIARGTFLWHTISVIMGTMSTAALCPVYSLDVQRDSRTAQPPAQALLLPVEKLRIAAARVNKLLEHPTDWEEATSLLNAPPFSETEFRIILDRYSDSNWGLHILSDLYRNQGLESIQALRELVAFALEQERKGVEISREDLDDVLEAGRALSASLDKFVSLAPPADLRLVEELVAGPSM